MKIQNLIIFFSILIGIIIGIFGSSKVFEKYDIGDKIPDDPEILVEKNLYLEKHEMRKVTVHDKVEIHESWFLFWGRRDVKEETFIKVSLKDNYNDNFMIVDFPETKVRFNFDSSFTHPFITIEPDIDMNDQSTHRLWSNMFLFNKQGLSCIKFITINCKEEDHLYATKDKFYENLL